MTAKVRKESDAAQSAESSLSKSPALIFFFIALTVFVSEALVMLLLHYFPQVSFLDEILVDSLLLVLLISPALYFLLFRPMVAHIHERQKIEATLLKNKEEQFKTMVRASLDGFWLTDMRGRFVEVNDAYCEMLGYSREELLAMGVSDVEAVETPEATARHIAELMEVGSTRFETRHRQKNGNLLDVEVGANYTPEYGGQIYCFLRDITARKQAEIAVLTSEANLRAILDNSPYLTWLKDTEGRYITVNKVFAEYLRLEDARQAVGKTDLDLQPKALAEKYRADDDEVMAARQQKHVEESAFDGSATHWVETFKTPIIDRHGDVLGTVGFARNITERKQKDLELQKFKAIVESTNDAIISKTLDGIIESWNPAAERIFGFMAEEVMGRQMQILIPPDRMNEESEILARIARGERIEHFETMRCRKDGKLIDISATISPILGDNGQVIGASNIATDITERKLAELALRENEARLKDMFENLSSGVAVYHVSPDGRDFVFTAFNKAAERIDNMHREDLIGKNVVDVFPGVTEFGLLEVFRHVWQSGVAKHFPISFYQDERIASWRDNYVYKLPNDEIVAIYDDVTKEKQAEEKMHQLAHFDALTGLPNRTLFADRLQQSLATARRDKGHFAMMFIDLDKFKPVNDELGHDVGDLLLKEVAKRMQHYVRESDTVSRIGGDEFVVLLPVVEAAQDAMLVAEKILHALNQPFELAGHSISISASIGVAVYPEHGSDEKMLTKSADTAMYHAKNGGRNNARLYQSDMTGK